MTAPEPRFPDLLALDVHRFRDFTTDRTIRRGISWYRSGRITQFTESDEGIEVTFDGGAREEPAGSLTLLPPESPGDPPSLFSQSLGVDWSEEDCWGYAVAAVLAYQATRPVNPAVLADTADRMRLERLERARQEVALRPIGDADDPAHLLGNFLAHSVGVTRPGRDAYRVQIRSLSHRINGCTCPDFRQGRLGLCKHIAAALLRAGKHASAQPVPTRARLFRAFDADDVPHWGILAPEALAPRIEDGERVTRAMRIPLDSLPSEDLDTGLRRNGAPPPGLVAWQLPDGDNDLLLTLVEAWTDDPHIDIGSDILAAVDDILERRQRTLRARRVNRLLDDADGDIPGLRVRPFPYQWDGIRFLVRNGRALLADDMGLGKTMQAIAATTFMQHHGEVQRALIVCPTSLLTQWADEFQKFTGTRPTIIEGNGQRRRALLHDRPPIAITTFERARIDFDTLHRVYAPDLLIVDEAQRVKNWATKNAQYIAALSTPFAFILTGTPLENKLEELFALMQLVDPDTLGPLWRFSQEFCVTDLAGLPIGYRNLSTLRHRLDPVLLRRTRNDVLKDLPERTDTDLHIPLSPNQRRLHDETVKLARRLGAVRRRRPLSPAESKRLLALLQHARMACNAAALVDPSLPSSSPKIDTLLELLEELCLHEERKVVVFSEWIKMAELCIPRIRDELGLRVLHLHGGVPSHRRGQLIEDFNTDPRARVFFSSDAGGVGLNLQTASALIHLDCPWNPAILEQRSARVHRHGQTEKVQIIRLLAQDAYESHVAALVEDKRSLFDATISPDADVDALALGGKQLDRMLEALSTPQERHAAGTWKDSAAALTGDAITSPDSPDSTPSTPQGTPAGTPDLPTSPQDSTDLSRADQPRGADEARADAPDHEALATRIARQAGDARVSAGTLCSTLRDLLRALEASDAARLGERTVFVRSGGAIDPSDHAPLRLVALGEAQWDGAMGLVAEVDGSAPVDLLAPGVGDWLEAHADVDRPIAGVMPDAGEGDAFADVQGLDADEASSRAASGELGAREARDKGSARPRPDDTRVVSAHALWGAGQTHLALRLMVEAQLDAAAAALSVRLPDGDDTWRWLYAEALPAGAVSSQDANALALALAVVRMGEVADTARVEEAWGMVA